MENEEVPVIAVKVAGEVHVYRNRCPHQGRCLDFAPGRVLHQNGNLVCAAHGAVFAMDSGLCLQGPCCGESLQAFDHEIRQDGSLSLLGLKTSD